MKKKSDSIFNKVYVDYTILICLIILAFFSLLLLYSSEQNIDLIKKQLLRFIISFIMMIALAQIPYPKYKNFAIFFYIVSLLLLILVLFLGHVTKGAQRWLDFFFIKMQPSELLKLSVPIMLSSYFDNKIMPPSYKNILFAFIIVIVPVLLVALQPDLGTSILISCVGFFPIFFRQYSITISIY